MSNKRFVCHRAVKSCVSADRLSVIVHVKVILIFNPLMPAVAIRVQL